MSQLYFYCAKARREAGASGCAAPPSPLPSTRPTAASVLSTGGLVSSMALPWVSSWGRCRCSCGLPSFASASLGRHGTMWTFPRRPRPTGRNERVVTRLYENAKTPKQFESDEMENEIKNEKRGRPNARPQYCFEHAGRRTPSLETFAVLQTPACQRTPVPRHASSTLKTSGFSRTLVGQVHTG